MKAAPLCPSCNKPIDPAARFCRNCGASLSGLVPAPSPAVVAAEPPPEEIVLPSPKRMRVDGDKIDLRALQQMVNEGVEWWQTRLKSGEASRNEAASSIEELRQALGSVSKQIESGRETIRITTTLPAQRRFPVGCPRCGKGNRLNARFCIACGRPFATPIEKPAPIQRLHFMAAVQSHTGMKRNINQDSALIQNYTLGDGSNVLCGIVADGMGGAKGGERASALAIATIDAHLAHFCKSVNAEYTGWRDVIKASIVAANSAVFRDAEKNPQFRGMGTTVVMVLIVKERAIIGNAGDSRAYLINGNGVSDKNTNIVQLTSDHSMVARLVDIGQITPEEARVHPRRNVLYRSVGVEATIDPDVDEQPLQEGDWLLLCSDGIVNELEDDEISRIVLTTPSTRRASNLLIEEANAKGAKDNVTALLISTKLETKPSPTASQ